MKIFITDGSLKCFYTTVFYAYKYNGCIITSNKSVQLSFDSQVQMVHTEKDKSERVCSKIRQIDELVEDEIALVLRSADPLKEQIAFEYIKLLIKQNRPIRNILSNPTVLEMNEIRQQVAKEIHNMHGFLRFMETAQGIMYAPYSPDNDITDLICHHFIRRFKSLKFVIHDLKRKKAVIYDGCNWFLTEVGEAEIYLSEYEKTFETLWKRYFL